MKTRAVAFIAEEGQLYQCGDHLLGCGDLLKGHFDAFFENEAYDWVYSDPPWGAGNAKYWRTMNNQRGVDPDYDGLIERVVGIAKRARIGAFLEMGLRWSNLFPSLLDMSLTHEWTTLYGSPQRPNLVQMFLRRPNPLPDDLTHMTGINLVRKAMEVMEPGQVVCDPCLGLGTTLKAGHERGLRVLGTELNPKRISKCLEWCSKKGM